MILVDTAIWIDHFANADERLYALLDREAVLLHPFVLGEIGLGYLPDRKAALADLGQMPQAEVAQPEEVLGLINNAGLSGSGIGYVDAHLVASAMLTDALIWTRDRRLAAVASRLGLGFDAGN